MRLVPAPLIPDLAPDVLVAIGDDARAGEARDRGDLVTLLRWVLGALAVVQIAVAVPALLGSDAGLPVHTARHLGSFDVAIAVGFLFAAWKPSRIAGMLPVLGALAVCLVISAVLDVAAGNTAALSESHHITDFAGLIVMWLIGRETHHAVALA
jgi:predicted anti-sigma-YlaC factor YlaD